MEKRDINFFKLGAVVIIVTLVIGTLILGIIKLIIPQKEVVETPKTTKSIEEIIEENKTDIEKTNSDSLKVTSAADIYSIIHKMSNTLIVAEDGLVYGEVPINDEQINTAMNIVSKTDLIDKSEKKILLNILNRWKKKDFSQSVIDHNYVWKKLNGSIGRANALRPEFRK